MSKSILDYFPNGHKPSDIQAKVLTELELRWNSSNVFVYGTEVEDLTTIDKSYLYTLNVCATQVLSRKIDTLEASNSAMISRIEQLESELNTLQDSFNK